MRPPRRPTSSALLAAAAVATATGCVARSDRPLPVAYGGVAMDCEGGAQPPSLAGWLAAADVVVIGTVAELQKAPLPARRACSAVDDPLVEDVAECADGFIECGVTVRLVDIEVLRGETSSPVDVRFGREVAGGWQPMLVCTDDELAWLPDTADRRLEPGQRIGGALYFDDRWQLLSPKEGVLFQVLADDSIRPQEFANEDCIQPVPAGLADASLTELRAIAADVEAADVPDDELQRLRFTQPDDLSRLTYLGGMCFERCE